MLAAFTRPSHRAGSALLRGVRELDGAPGRLDARPGDAVAREIGRAGIDLGETIGLLHGDAEASGRALDALDVEVMAKFSRGLSGVLERAVLRHTLELHRGELESALRWMSGRLTRLSDARAPEADGLRSQGHRRLVESLTPRELEVLRLLSAG